MSTSIERHNKIAALLFFAIIGIFGSGASLGQDQRDQPIIIGKPAPESTTFAIDRVDLDRLMVIINDTEYKLAPVVKYKGSNWSRERLIQQLQEGESVYYEVDDPQSPQPQTVILISEPRNQ